jgi:hypothetical protein
MTMAEHLTRLLAVAAIVSFSQLPARSQSADHFHFGGIHALTGPPPGGCTAGAQALAPSSSLTPPLAFSASYFTRALLPHVPIGATLDRDAHPAYLIDDQPGPGMHDWNCTGRCYDGHNGMDLVVRGFSAQALGVPVFAALDGVVTYAQDGQPDMNTVPMGQPGNEIYIDHGFGRQTQYYHLRKNSVAVVAGQFVRAGEQIGMVGSSGNSSGPHLHFGVVDDFQAIDPSVGTCHPGTSAWVAQPPIEYGLRAWDFAFSRSDLSSVYFPADAPRTGQIELADPLVYPWFMFMNMPASSTWRIEWIRPNGTTSYDTGTQALNNPPYVNGWLAFSFDLADLHSITGTWQFKLTVNGVVVANSPLEVVTTFNPSFNRPPAAITVAFDPASPTDADAVYCRVASDPVLCDLDHDFLRYHYVWKVNGASVRDVTHCGQADAIPHHTAHVGDALTCEVTPRDAVVNGPMALASTTVGSGAPAPLAYCSGKINALGCAPMIGCSGTPSASAASGFTVIAALVRNNKPGLMFYGPNGPQSAPFQNGTLCVQTPVNRAILSSSGGTAAGDDCSGVYSLDLNAFARGALGGSPSPLLSIAGTRINCQWWGRDPGFAPPNNTTLSDGLQIWIGP